MRSIRSVRRRFYDSSSLSGRKVRMNLYLVPANRDIGFGWAGGDKNHRPSLGRVL